jgi:hypothetical protein
MGRLISIQDLMTGLFNQQANDCRADKPGSACNEKINTVNSKLSNMISMHDALGTLAPSEAGQNFDGTEGMQRKVL